MPSLLQLILRVLRLSCPACGRGRIFRRYFVRAERCSGCERRFEREEGYWVGGSEVHMFASFGLSVLVCLPFLIVFEPTPLLYAAVILGHVVLSLLVFRYSRAIFLALDYWLDPAPAPGGGDDRGGAPAPARPQPPLAGLARRAGRAVRSGRREPAAVN
ncbi:MAG: DUF983 domain-containing protein [Planctomycetota bacterium]